MLNISIDNNLPPNPGLLNAICKATLGSPGMPVLQPSMVPPNTTLYDMSMNEIWALEGNPRIITNWSDCTGQSWPPAPPPGTAATPYAGYYADGCIAPEIFGRLAPRLEGRLDGGGTSASPNVVTGLYGLQVSATPEKGTCLIPVIILAAQQGPVLQVIKAWWAQNQHNAPANLNIMPGDFLGDPAGETGWPIVQTALGLNQNAQAPQLSAKSDPTALKPVTVTCNNPRATPPTLVVYPAAEGAQSPNRETFTGVAGATSVQAKLSVEDFPPPTGPAAPGGDVAYLRAECAQGAAPSQSSRIVIPPTDFGTLPLLFAKPADPLSLPFACLGSGPEPVQVTAYPPAAGPNSPDAQVFVSENGQPAVQATYSRRGNYDVRLDCLMAGAGTKSLTVPAGAFAPVLTIRKGSHLPVGWLYCDRGPQLTSPATLTLAAQTSNAPPPLSATSSNATTILTVPTDYFPNGDYQLTATCGSSGTPPFTATPLTLSSSQVLTLRAIPSSGLQLGITCVNPGADGIHAVAYPASAGPNSPDAQTFEAPAGQSTLQATYTRRANYDVRVDCSLGGGPIQTVTVPASAFPPLLSIRKGGQLNVFLYCDRDPQLKSPATLNLAAQTPNPPSPLSVTGSAHTIVLTVQPDCFPAGDYQLTTTCASRDSPPFTATPLILSSSQIPTQKVTAEITDCSAQGEKAYACRLQVTVGVPLAVNTVFSVGIGGGGFLNRTGGERPQATAIQGCQGPPLPSPYLPDGNGGYTRYDVNIGPGGCTPGAVMTFGEAVTGAAKATITQPVTVPGLGTSTATFVLP